MARAIHGACNDDGICYSFASLDVHHTPSFATCTHEAVRSLNGG